MPWMTDGHLLTAPFQRRQVFNLIRPFAPISLHGEVRKVPAPSLPASSEIFKAKPRPNPPLWRPDHV